MQKTRNARPGEGFLGFSGPRIRGDSIAFYGFGSVPDGLYLWNGSAAQIVADTTMPMPGQGADFWGFFELSVNAGRVALFAQGLGGDPQGLFLYEKGFVRPIFISGQMLDGRAVFVQDFAQEGLSGNRLVFSVLYLVSTSPLVLGQAVYLAIIPLFADSDDDGDVDHVDAATFVSCMAGPNAPPNPQPGITAQECLAAFDGDMEDDVDLTDFAKFQMAFSGE